jgi:3-oxoadipate enol-lactonase
MSARVETDGAAIAAEVTGNEAGDWIILSNSLGATRAMWGPQRAWLEETRRVLSYDTRGHGDSSTPAGDYTFGDLVGDVVALMDHFGIDRADFMGLSLGGMTGLGLALDHPGRVRRLVCCDARADAPEPFAKSWDERIAAIRAGGMTAIWPGTLERWLTPATQAEKPDLVAALKADFEGVRVDGYAGCAAALKRLDYLRRLPQMQVQTLYVVGAEDAGAPPAVMRAMADATPGAKFAEIAAAAHIANLDNPTDFDTAIRAFLA